MQGEREGSGFLLFVEIWFSLPCLLMMLSRKDLFETRFHYVACVGLGVFLSYLQNAGL